MAEESNEENIENEIDNPSSKSVNGQKSSTENLRVLENIDVSYS